jgi:GGDEF domain-containing protein
VNTPVYTRRPHDPDSDLIPPSLDPGGQELAEERSEIDQRDSWLRRYSTFVSLLLTFAIIVLAVLALRQGTEQFVKVRLTEAIFVLVALIAAFNFYTIRQEILIQRLRGQLTEKQNQFYSLRNLAMIDPLTGLYNRRFAEQRLSAEVARSDRMGHPLGLLLLDLNDFRQLNDTITRAAGDQALQTFANRLTRVIRSSDLAVRLEDDAFLILLPECTADQIQRVLSRLNGVDFDWRGRKIPLAFTAAWQQYSRGERPEEFLARVTQALSSAKLGQKSPAADTVTA